MKSLKLVCMAMLCMAVSLVSCSGEDGETGPQGPQGPQGEQGIQGQQGADSPTVDFYFQNGFKGYEGTSDANIVSTGTGLNEDFVQLFYSFNGLATGERRALFRFDGIGDAITSQLVGEGQTCSDAFYVSKATLYVYIDSYLNATFDNLYMKVGFYGADDPIFVEEEVNWSMANVNDDWADIGAESAMWAGPIGSDDYPLLLPKGSGSAYGWFPIILPRSVVENWICNPDSNKGIRLRLDPNSDENGQGDLRIVAKENTLEDLRPLLIVETENINSEASKNGGSSTKELNWENLSYEEKMAPLFRYLESKEK
ncbi:MAG: hypothetical protein ACE37L_10850 [Allomuricauda sp.]